MSRKRNSKKRVMKKGKVDPVLSLVQRCEGLEVEWKDSTPYESNYDSLFDFKYRHKNPISNRMIKDFFARHRVILMELLELNWVVEATAVFENPDGSLISNSHRLTQCGSIDDLRGSMMVMATAAIEEVDNPESFKYIKIKMLSLGWRDYKWPDDYEFNADLTDEIINKEIGRLINEIYREDEDKQSKEQRLICAD